MTEEWVSAPESLGEETAREALKAAYKVIAPAIVAYEQEKTDHTAVMRSIVSALEEIKRVERAADNAFESKIKPKKTYGVDLDKQHIIATAILASVGPPGPIEDWHPYSRMANCIPIYAATTIVLRSFSDFQEMQDGEYMDGLFRWADGSLLLDVLPKAGMKIRRRKKAGGGKAG